MENSIEHFGIKGMRWGIRKGESGYVKSFGAKIPYKDAAHKARVEAAVADHKAKAAAWEKDRTNAQAGIDAYYAKRKVEEVSEIPIQRLGKLVGESDAQFDKRVNEANESAYKAAAQIYSDKKKMKTVEGEVEVRKRKVKEEIDMLVELNRFEYKKNKMEFDEKAMKAYLEDLPWNKKEIELTPENVKMERVQRGISVAFQLLAISGLTAATLYSSAQIYK